MKDASSDISHLNSKKNTRISSKNKKGKKGNNKTKKNKEIKIYEELEESYDNRKKADKCYKSLESFYNNLNEIDLDSLITEDNLNYFKDLNPTQNLGIDILLNKIYYKIFSSEDFYKNYFLDSEKNDDKIPLIFELIEITIKNIGSLVDNVISFQNFQLKENLLKLIKFIYINLKNDITDKEETHLNELLNNLPQKFFSQNYVEIIKFKKTIYRNNEQLLKNIEKIDSLFFDLETYYEQLNCFELLFDDIETNEQNQKTNNYSSVSNKDIKMKKYRKVIKEASLDDDEDEETKNTTKESKNEEEIIKYGQFLLKICIYQKFLLKNGDDINDEDKKNKEKEEEEEEEEDDEEEEEEEEEEDKGTKKKDNKVKENEKNKKDKIKKNDIKDEEIESKDNDKNIQPFFLFDFINGKKGKKMNKSKEKDIIEELLNDKKCISLYEKNNLVEIIKKNIDNFKYLSKRTRNKTIKSLKTKLSLYLESINENKYIPINIDYINSIKYYCNFSKNTIVVPNRDSKELYIENDENKKGLLLLEFFLTEENKDIICKINKYNPLKDDFCLIFDTGKVNKKCRFCIYFEEKSIYQIEFDNSYSWINSKEVNFSISLLRIKDDSIEEKPEEINNDDRIDNKNNEEEISVDKSKIKNKKNKNKINNDNDEDDKIKDKDENEEEEEVENNEETDEKLFDEFKVCKPILKNTKEIKFSCLNGNKNYTFNCNKIYKKVKDYQILDSNNLLQNKENYISILVDLNKMRIIKIDNNEKITYHESVYEDEKLLTKEFFNKNLSKYLDDNYKIDENDDKNKKLLVNIYSQNKDLTLESKKIKELVSALKDNSINNMEPNKSRIYIQFVQKIGFYPDKILGEHEINYFLYDFSDQCLIYHLFLNSLQGIRSKNSNLVLIFDKYSLHVTAMNKGAIFTKFKSLEKSWNQKYYSKLKMDVFKSIVDFITAISESFESLDLVLCYMDNEDKKNNLVDLFRQIKEYTNEKIDKSINVYIYKEDNFIIKIFKYISLFSPE